jgi:hypothetical protein
MLDGVARALRKYRSWLIVIVRRWVPLGAGCSEWRHVENLGRTVLSTLPEVSHPLQGWGDLSQLQPVGAPSILL